MQKMFKHSCLGYGAIILSVGLLNNDKHSKMYKTYSDLHRLIFHIKFRSNPNLFLYKFHLFRLLALQYQFKCHLHHRCNITECIK